MFSILPTSCTSQVHWLCFGIWAFYFLYGHFRCISRYRSDHLYTGSRQMFFFSVAIWNPSPIVCSCKSHDDDNKWKHFSRYWPFVRGIHRSPVISSHKGQWRRAGMFSLICVWINGWVNNREAGDLRRYRAHHDVSVMLCGHSLSTLFGTNGVNV